MRISYIVTGMTCDGCARAVTNAVRRVSPNAQVEVDLAAGRVTVDAAANDSDIAKAIEAAGFGFAGRAA